MIGLITGALWGLTLGLGALLLAKMFGQPVHADPPWFWHTLFVALCTLLGGVS